MSSLVRASLWLTISELVFNLSGYVTHSVLGRFLGPAEYGRYSLIITFSTMVIILIGKGVPIAMSKYLSEIQKDESGKILSIKRTSLKFQFFLVGFVTLLYFFLAPLFAGLMRDPSLTNLFRLSSLIIPSFALASFYVYYFIGIQKFELQAILKFFRSFAKIIVITALAYFLGTSGAVLGHALAPFLVFLVAFSLDPYKNTTKSNQKFPWKKLVNFAWPITLFMIFYELLITVDLYLVKALLRDDALTGIYNSAITVGRIPFYAFYFLTIILLPKISQTTSQGLEKQTKKILALAMRFMFMLLLPSIALLSAFSESAISFFYGEKYSSGSAALEILAIGAGCLSIFYVLAFVLNGAGKNKAPMWIALIGLVSNSLLVFSLIPKFGILGAAIGTTLTSFVLMFLIVFYTNKKVAKFLNLSSLFKYIFASVIIYFLASNYFSQGKFIFILWSTILLVIYFLILFIFKEIGKKDWLFVKNSLRKK